MEQLAAESPEMQQMEGKKPTVSSASTILIELTEDELSTVAGGTRGFSFTNTASGTSTVIGG
jgi:hypothetical protein